MTAATPARSGEVAADRYKWEASGVIILGALMTILDSTIVNVAIPTFEKEFNAPLNQVQWVLTGYMLALGAVIPLAGYLTDRLGSKRVFVTSQVIFVLGSALCGLAWSNESLIAFRILQGLGGGLVMPVGMAIAMRVVPPDERGRMMAVLGLPMLLAPVLGPTLGGWLIQQGDWRLIFYINVPVGAVAVAAAAVLLRPGREFAIRERIDVVGLLLAAPGMVGVLYGLSQPSTYGWTSRETLVPLLLGVLTLAVFTTWELRRPSPLLDLRVFGDAAFAASTGVASVIGIALFGAVFMWPVFLQQVQGWGTLDTGMILAAQGVGAGVAMPFGGILMDRIGARRVIPGGLVVLVAATLWMTQLKHDTAVPEMLAMLALRGVGMGLSMMPSMAAAFATMPLKNVAHATAVSNVLQRVSGSFGVALTATILQERITANLPKLPGSTSLPTGGAASLQIPEPLKDVILTQVTKAFDDAFWVSAGIALLALPLVPLLRDPVRRAEVRRYAVREMARGLVLLTTLRQAERGRLPVADPVDRGRLAEGSLAHLRHALTLLRAGSQGGGLVPRPPLGTPARAAVGALLVVSLVGLWLCVATGYAPRSVPDLTRLAAAPAASHPAGSAAHPAGS